MARVQGLVILMLWAACSGGDVVAPAATTPVVPAPPAPTPPVAISAAPGVAHFKSGPIQVTADGAFVWVANPDNGSVSRIETATNAVFEFVLPGGGEPHGLSVKDDGSEVWVANLTTDKVFLLSGAGAVLATLDLPWGSGPHQVALSRDGSLALVTLHRGDAVAVIDTAARRVAHVLSPVFLAPHGITFSEDGTSAWITHPFANGEHSHLTRIDISGAEPKVASQITVFATDPRQSGDLSAPNDIAEGGYVTFRGHLAQFPGRREIWLPTQYNNIHEDRFSPDSTVQATLRRLDLDTLTVSNSNSDKVILSAVHVHTPTGGNAPYEGPGWNATVSGLVDIGFTRDAATCYVLSEHSNEVVIVPTNTPAVKPPGAAALGEVRVGDRPIGLAVSPTTGAVYVANRLSRDVSVIDPDRAQEVERIATTPVTGETRSAAFVKGAKLFHTSADPRVSNNEKVSCGSCHINAEHDGRDWGFHALPGRSGGRSTTDLRTLGLTFGGKDPTTGFGQLHRSGDRDEVQDFEHTFRSPAMGGTGFLGSSVQPELGAPNGGRDADLDAMAHYLLNLEPPMRSPYRESDGSLSEAAQRGAVLFVGSARCADCHVPETGFVDFKVHDVGQRRGNNEEELNHSSRSPYQWHVRTRTLVGVWSTPPYDGLAGFAQDIVGALKDFAGRSSHGSTSQLTAAEMRDLAAFVLSIDGNTTATEVRGAADTSPPRILRVEAASLTQVDVWFSECVDQASAETLSNWSVSGATVTAAQRSADGDRVTLTTQLAKNTNYTVAAGAIADPAGNQHAGAPVSLPIGDTLTITLGSSGAENIRIEVHDAGMAGPGLSTWSHDAPWLFINNGQAVLGFVRFDWRDAFAQATGVSDSGDIVSAAFSLHAQHGHAHPVEARRCLLSWSDTPNFKDFNSNGPGAPTWRDHAHPNDRWNQSGARRRSAGVDGTSPSHYDGANDVAFLADTVANMVAINERLSFEGAGVTDAFRFWFNNQSVDYGYALQLATGTAQSARFFAHEDKNGPVLTITYRLK